MAGDSTLLDKPELAPGEIDEELEKVLKEPEAGGKDLGEDLRPEAFCQLKPKEGQEGMPEVSSSAVIKAMVEGVRGEVRAGVQRRRAEEERLAKELEGEVVSAETEIVPSDIPGQKTDRV